MSNLAKSMNKDGAKLRNLRETTKTLKSITAPSLLKEISQNISILEGKRLGMLKAWHDIMPVSFQSELKVRGLPLNMAIKMKIDQLVLFEISKLRKTSNAIFIGFGFKKRKTYLETYNRFRQMICGCGYNCKFIEKRFRDGFIGSSSYVVEGFATGYSEMFQIFASGDKHYTHHTDPIEEDIWKNWEYFLSRECFEYSLEGLYIPMYNGGAPKAFYEGQFKTGFHTELRNKGIYESLRTKVTDTDFKELLNICKSLT